MIFGQVHFAPDGAKTILRSLVAINISLLRSKDEFSKLHLKFESAEDNEERSSEMDIKRSGSQPSGKGPDEYFTGMVRIDPLFQAPDPARVLGVSVTFEPGARTAWHTHPLGQTLIVTSGCGWVQSEGGPKEEIRPGDVVRCPPGEKPWHGATSRTAMTQ